MAVNPSALGPKPQIVDSAGEPYVGGRLFFYVAGSVGTKQDTYTDSTGVTANTNPVVLNSLGEPSTQIWWTSGLAYKVVLAPPGADDPPSSPVWTIDNLRGINDTTVGNSQWLASGSVPTYVSATQFTLAGDQTNDFEVGRRVKCTVTAGTVYGTIASSAYAVLTTVTIQVDSPGALDSGLSAVELGLLTTTSPSIPRIVGATAVAHATNTNPWLSEQVTLTGSAVTFTDIADAPYVGAEVWIYQNAAHTWTNGATFVIQGGANYVAAAGDWIRLYATTVSTFQVTIFKVSGVPISMTPITASLGANVALNNTGLYFDGPSVAQGTSGTWFVSGTVTLVDAAGAANFRAKLWDGTSVISSSFVHTDAANNTRTLSLSGYISSPAGNIRISIQDETSTSGVIAFNISGNSKDSTITAIRIA
ncbi:MAG: hypothetical protein WC100_05895 [Sterolibacterium sp.]